MRVDDDEAGAQTDDVDMDTLTTAEIADSMEFMIVVACHTHGSRVFVVGTLLQTLPRTIEFVPQQLGSRLAFYDVATNTWTVGPEVPAPTSAEQQRLMVSGIGFFAQQLVVIDYSNQRGADGVWSFHSRAHLYDFDGTWTALPPPPLFRGCWCFLEAGVGGFFFTTGVFHPANAEPDVLHLAVQRYDTATSTWTVVRRFDHPHPSCVVRDGRFYWLRGDPNHPVVFDNTTRTITHGTPYKLESYDPVADALADVTDVPQDMHALPLLLLCIDGALVVVSSWVDESDVLDARSLDADGNGWSEFNLAKFDDGEEPANSAHDLMSGHCIWVNDAEEEQKEE